MHQPSEMRLRREADLLEKLFAVEIGDLALPHSSPACACAQEFCGYYEQQHPGSRSVVRQWCLGGAALFHVGVRRGRPRHPIAAEVDPAAFHSWFTAPEKPGTEENARLQAVLAACERDWPDVIDVLVATLWDDGSDQAVVGVRLTPADVSGALRVGFLIEFALELAAATLAEQRREENLVAHVLLKESDDGGIQFHDFTSPEVLRELGLLPWPKDLTCRCGADLRPYVFCCDGRSPIDIEALTSELGPGFVLETPCCGAQLTGFRCDACHQIYSWDLGCVPRGRDLG